MVESNTKTISKEATQKFLDEHFESWFVKGVSDFIREPNLSLLFDPTYLTNGKYQKAMELVKKYVDELKIEGISFHEFGGNTKPSLYVYIVEPT